ncbi:MAG: hypothetical protein IJU19_05240 [Bacteroidales bacterium]|nr:hypothetical protein [Bacteroidales bacterium]
MTQFKIGDKVKFLNAVGGGIVRNIQGGMVYVEDESGFDMPFAPGELIRMEDQQGIGRVFNGEPAVENMQMEDVSPRKATNPTSDGESTSSQLAEENRRLRSQNANLQDQIKRLQSQVLSLQRTIARIS